MFKCKTYGEGSVSLGAWHITITSIGPFQAITIGEGWLAACTDKRIVRLYTVGGVQKEIFNLPGPVVCMAANGSQLMVVYHNGTGMCFITFRNSFLD